MDAGVANYWRRRKNVEMIKIFTITSYIKGQRIEWFVCAKQREQAKIKH